MAGIRLGIGIVFPVLEGQPRTLIGYRFEFICIPGPSKVRSSTCIVFVW